MARPKKEAVVSEEIVEEKKVVRKRRTSEEIAAAKKAEEEERSKDFLVISHRFHRYTRNYYSTTLCEIQLASEQKSTDG